MQSNRIPLEKDVQKQIISDLEVFNQGCKLTNRQKLLFHSPSSELLHKLLSIGRFSSSIRNRVLGQASSMGFRSGFPDLVIVVPAEHSISNQAVTLYIELKRASGGKVSDSQKEWHEAFNETGANAYIACGYEEANKILSFHIKQYR